MREVWGTLHVIRPALGDSGCSGSHTKLHPSSPNAWPAGFQNIAANFGQRKCFLKPAPAEGKLCVA